MTFDQGVSACWNNAIQSESGGIKKRAKVSLGAFAATQD
jgi:hypothetical protein